MTAFTATTSLDQIQHQVLNKDKQQMKLEAVKQKQKDSYGGVGPTAENCSLWYPEKHWSLWLKRGTERGRDTPVWIDVKGKSPCAHTSFSDHMSNLQRRQVGKNPTPFDPLHCRLRGHKYRRTGANPSFFSKGDEAPPISKQWGGLQRPSTGSPAMWDFMKTKQGRREGSVQQMAEAKD